MFLVRSLVEPFWEVHECNVTDGITVDWQILDIQNNSKGGGGIYSESNTGVIYLPV